jgi:autoinducer 2 (AI-2) kinase
MTPESLDALNELLPVTYESWSDTQRLADPEELAARIDAEGVSVLVVEADFLPLEFFQQAPNLRLVAVTRTGVAHVDLAAASRCGVAVINAPGRNAQAVAELTIGLMLALARKIPSMDANIKAGHWQSPVAPYIAMQTCERELGGKTLGVLGLGSVGRRVARLAGAFDMSVSAYDPYLEGAADTLPAKMAPTLAELTSESDYISVNVPGGPTTRGLLGRKEIENMKAGCRIVNTSSYSVIDEKALVDALRSGRLGGLALDVFETHPVAPNSPLLGLENVALTPHVGGATRETVARHSRMILDDIARFLRGERPQNLVNPAVWNDVG